MRDTVTLTRPATAGYPLPSDRMGEGRGEGCLSRVVQTR